MIGVGAGPLPCCGQYGSGQRLEIFQPMFHIRAHIYELEMWQKADELASLFSLAEHFELGTNNVRDPAVGIAIEMGTHVSEDGVRHVGMGFYPSLCMSGHPTDPKAVSRDLLGPLRCMCHD